MTALAYTVFSNGEQAKDVIRAVLEEKLAACANIMPDVESVFMWQGKLGTAQEVGVLFKTDASLLEELVKFIEQLHPYEVPAIVGWKCVAATDATRGWLGELARNGKKDRNSPA